MNELRRMAEAIGLRIAVHHTHYFAVRRYQGRLWSQIYVASDQEKLYAFLVGYKLGRNSRGQA